MKTSGRLVLPALFLLACMALGGASAAGALGNGLLQLAAVAILLARLWARGRAAAEDEAGRALQWAVLLVLALGAFQLLPLPPGLWTLLPGRGAVAQGFASLGLDLPWLTVSLAPEQTVAALLAFLPPLAIFVLALRRGVAESRLWPVLIVAIALVQLVLGLVQISGGRGSPLYFYAFTNWGHMVGFFSNTNHHATLMLMALPFAAGLATLMFRQRGPRQDVIAKSLILASLFAVLVGGVIVNGSRAGLLLLPAVLLLSACMIRMDMTRRFPKAWLALAGAAIFAGSIAALGSGAIAAEALGESQTSRSVIWKRTLPLVQAHAPAGSGLGTFMPLYRIAEDPQTRSATYINHAHNDYLEWALETGLPGIALLLLFIAWFARRSWAAWQQPEAWYARAASIAIAAVMLHSLVDYPLRTAAIATLFALCCALLASFGGGRGHLRESRTR